MCILAIVGPEKEFELGSDEFDAEAAANFSVVIAYDTPQTARRAMRLVDGVVEQFGREWNVHRNLWRFDILGLPVARQSATADAAKANLLVIATGGDADLPAPVKAWLAEWSAKTISGVAALVGLLPSPRIVAEGQSPVHRFLQATAREAGQDFFAQELPVSPITAQTTAGDIRRRADATSSVLLGILEQNRPSSRWGLNE
jgi:hypothetical protein